MHGWLGTSYDRAVALILTVLEYWVAASFICVALWCVTRQKRTEAEEMADRDAEQLALSRLRLDNRQFDSALDQMGRSVRARTRIAAWSLIAAVVEFAFILWLVI